MSDESKRSNYVTKPNIFDYQYNKYDYMRESAPTMSSLLLDRDSQYDLTGSLASWGNQLGASTKLPSTDFLSWDRFLGTEDQPGWGKPALQAASILGTGWLGMKGLGQAEDELAENKRQFNLNYNAQRTAVNSAMADRQAARVASNPGGYQAVPEYMQQWGVA